MYVEQVMFVMLPLVSDVNDLQFNNSKKYIIQSNLAYHDLPVDSERDHFFQYPC